MITIQTTPSNHTNYPNESQQYHLMDYFLRKEVINYQIDTLSIYITNVL